MQWDFILYVSSSLSSYFVRDTEMFVWAHTDTVAELQGYVHWLKSSGWNIPGSAEKGGRREGLCDCSLEQEGGVEERGLAG